MIPFVCSVWKWQMYRDREQVSSGLWLGVRMGIDYKCTHGMLWGEGNVLKLDYGNGYPTL